MTPRNHPQPASGSTATSEQARLPMAADPPNPQAEAPPRRPSPDWYLALDEWVEEHYEAAVTAIAPRAEQDARDLVHDAVCVSWKRFDLKRGGLRQWCSGIVRHLASNRVRRLCARQFVNMDAAANAAGLAVEDSPSRTDSASCFGALLRRLPRRCISLLLAHHGEATPIKELARAAGVAPGTIKMRLLRARAQVRKILRAAGYASVADIERLGPHRLPRRIVALSSRPGRRNPRPPCSDSPQAGV